MKHLYIDTYVTENHLSIHIFEIEIVEQILQALFHYLLYTCQADMKPQYGTDRKILKNVSTF